MSEDDIKTPRASSLWNVESHGSTTRDSGTLDTCALDLDHLATGSAVLGTGGDPHIGKVIAAQAGDVHGPVPLNSPDELRDDDVVTVVSMSGAPSVVMEKIPNGNELSVVFERAATYAGKPPAAILVVEIGGINVLFSVAMAARIGVPLVDADGMGRVFPEFQMTAFNVGGVTFGPHFAADDKGNVIRIDGIDARWIERINRHALIAMGGWVIPAICFTGEDIKRTAIRGSISLARSIGTALHQARTEKCPWQELLLHACDGLLLFQGKVTSVERWTTGGFARGHAILTSIGAERDDEVRLAFQNEHLVARRGSDGAFPEIVGSTPDLLAVLDTETGTPITTRATRSGEPSGACCSPDRATSVGILTTFQSKRGWPSARARGRRVNERRASCPGT